MKSIVKITAVFAILTLLTLSVLAAPSAVDVHDIGVQESIVSTEAEVFGEDGTEANPFTISSTVEFNEYSSMIKGNNALYGGKYYKLTENVDFSEAEIIPFGTSTAPFSGTFDGNGYAITNVKAEDLESSGVIGYMSGGTVKNLSVVYKDMENEELYSSLKHFGGIVGYCKPTSDKNVVISGCETRGILKINTSTAAYFGGVAGRIVSDKAKTTISNCVSYVSFDVTSGGNGYLGGFAGHSKAGSSKYFSFVNCVSYGDVSLTSNLDEASVGGFCAYATADAEGWSGWASEDEAELFAETYHFKNCVGLGNVYAKAKTTTAVGGFTSKLDGEGSGSVKMASCYRTSNQDVSGESQKNTVNSSATVTDESNVKSQTFCSSLGYDFENKWYISGEKLCLRTVAKSLGAADVRNSASLRLSSYRNGLRFTADIDLFKRDYCLEYGFIVAMDDLLGSNELTHDFVYHAVGVGYDGGETDIFVDKDDENVTFSSVVFNIKPDSYSRKIAARAYVSYMCDGEVVTVYGNTVKKSVSEIASAFYEDKAYFDSLDSDEKALIESMLPKA